MCYNVATATRALKKYAMHRHADPAVIAELEEELRRMTPPLDARYQVSGFAHPNMLVFTSDEPLKPQAMKWGLIPSWTKDAEGAKAIANQTLNARSETIFEKPSFRNAARNRRCIIYADAFYEHHHANGRTYPFHISMKDGSPMVFAGLWDEWLDKSTGELIRTCTIVTCGGNPLMKKIHNNPKAEGPRMPVILEGDAQNTWLNRDLNESDVKLLASPLPEDRLSYHTVFKINGKDTLGNVPEAEAEFVYSDLNI